MSSVVTVINPVEGKRYKMSMKGEVSRLTVRKIKKYLANSCGIPSEEQTLKYNGVELGDDVLGGEVGLTSGSTLTVERKGPNDQPFIGSPAKQALEMETLDQQRAMLQHERMRREEEFRRHQETLQGSISQAEMRRRDLMREKQEKEEELRRLQELEEAAEKERERLAEYRKQEAEREAMRARDLEARKEQLSRERALQRQLEMQKLENERKKMLLQQQQAEYEAEKARVERERKEHQERIKRQELAIREKEVEMERAHVEAQRARRELEAEKAVLQQQRSAESHRLTHERSVEAQRLHEAVNSSHSNHHTPHTTDLHVRSNRSTSTPISNGMNNTRSSSIADKERELERLRQQKTELEQSLHYEKELERQIAIERSHLQGRSREGSPDAPPAAASHIPIITPRAGDTSGKGTDARALALENLGQLAQDLGVRSLQLDDNNTCVVSVEEKYTLLITFDASTERLYIYSTLATFIPANPDVKLRLYEFLMEGALLGRDMCGGGVGASLKNDFILMSTSIYLPSSSTSALRTIAPLFVESLVKWRARVKDLLASEDFGMATSEAQSSSRPRHPISPQPQDDHGYRKSERASNTRHISPSRQESHIDTGAEYPMVGIEVTDGVTVDGVHSKYDDGVVVVSAKGPAARAGILPNDYIRAVNGRPVNSLRTFQTVIGNLRPHTTVPFSLDRAGAHLVVSVLVGSSQNRPGESKYKNIVRVNSDAFQH